MQIELIERINLAEAAQLAGYKSVKQFKKVCVKNKLYIFQNPYSSKQFLLRFQLLDYLNQEPLKYLEGKRMEIIFNDKNNVIGKKSKLKNKIYQFSDLEQQVLAILKSV